LLTLYVAIIRVTNNFNAKNLCDSRVYNYLLPTYVFHPTFFNNVKEAMEKAGSADQLAATVDRAEVETFRASPSQLQYVRECLKAYVGTFNFHNFTVGAEYKGNSFNRFIKSFEVSCK
jgi:tRNA pseudouridine38-40 synthase